MSLTWLYMRAKTLILAHSGNSFRYAQIFHISDEHTAQAAKVGYFWIHQPYFLDL